MATLNMRGMIDLLRAVDEAKLPLSLLKRHIERVGEKEVRDSHLTILHRTGLDTDLYEAAVAGKLGQVDRTIFRHLLGLSPKVGEEEVGVASFDPETGIYTFEVNYDQSIAEKTAESEWNPKSLAWVTKYATDENFPDDRTGKRVVPGRIMYFNKNKSEDEFRRAVAKNRKILGRIKELIDFSKSFPRPALDDVMPLIAPGQSMTDDNGNHLYLCVDRNGRERGLSPIHLHSVEGWNVDWYFLLLDE